MRYSILGTVRAVRGEAELMVGPPKRLALLSLLLLRAPGPLTLSEAVDVLWEEDPPASAANVVHRHIGALRRVLEPGLSSRAEAAHLVRAADGYRLLVDASTSDLLCFRDLRAQARRALREGDPAGAARCLVEALRLWRGPVVAAGTPVAAHPAFVAVGHEFVSAVKEATDVVLASAPEWAEEVLTVLRVAVDCHPFDEALHSRIIGALAATGRQAEALRHFEAVRTVLAEELGVEPGPVLRAARQRLLRRDGGADTRGADTRGGETRGGDIRGGDIRGAGPRDLPLPAPREQAVRAAQLPADSAVFTGRETELAQLDELLGPAGENCPPGAAAVVCGMAGIGKTTLALHFAHRLADRFPDGRVHLDLQGHHPTRDPLDTPQAMRGILDALGTPHDHHTSTSALTALYRATLAGRRLLLVLDDARDCAHIRPLLPATPGTLTVITSRRRLEGLAVTHNARIIPVHPMSPAESLRLLARRLGTHRTRSEPDAAHRIAGLCAGHPLALTLAATRAQTNPHFPLTALAAHLEAHAGTLAAFTGPDPHTDLRQALDRTHQLLTAGAAALFRLLSLHPAPVITVATAASLAATDPGTTHQHLTELADHHLLAETALGHYALHPLLRAHATELARTRDTPAERSTAHTRIWQHYLHTVEAAVALLAPGHGLADLPPPLPGVCPQRFSGRADAAAWTAAERPALLALVRDPDRSPRDESLRKQLTDALGVSLPPGAP
ncbi:AfsR/SARP family transcriptional regulator [Streptomyces sp. NRRL S-340]|uniref:AfsR/SARP family transcriptional regulator n=1 Tax=Streptomyces sp. NRRL S-340 TaxID=1463901 RepID=UPI00099CDE99|nr:BTAD domain-containing putative transcriptional regulator [Streptomyces sp. NRRL S-340]